MFVVAQSCESIVDARKYDRGVELLEGVVSTLTKML